MIQTLFINEQQLKDIAPISTNVTITSPTKQMILDAQRKYIYPIICQDMYEQLQLEIETNTVTAANLALLTNIKYCLAYYALYMALPFYKLRVREQGPGNQTGDNMVNADLEEFKYLRQQITQSAEIWQINLQNFIEDNSVDYPLISSCGCAKCKPCGGPIRPNNLFRVV
jgi:hypothetical protein